MNICHIVLTVTLLLIMLSPTKTTETNALQTNQLNIANNEYCCCYRKTAAYDSPENKPSKPSMSNKQAVRY